MPPTKRKAEATKEDVSPKKNRKMTKEEKEKARERARAAMMGTSSSSAVKSPKRAATKKSPKSTTTAAAAATRTTKVSKDAPTDNTDNMMAMPPPMLQRNQSTPLELELQQQVIANSEAMKQGKPVPFTGPPPDHLMKFAPKESEEGYDLPENNDGESWVEVPLPSGQQQPKSAPVSTAIGLGVSTLLEVLLIVGWFYFFYVREGAQHHLFFRRQMVKLAIPGNPYRTSSGNPVPLTPCYVTNTNAAPLQRRSECLNKDPEIKLEPCPAFGECAGGGLQGCKQKFYMEVDSRTGRECVLKESVAEIYDQVVQLVQDWTLRHSCRVLDRKNSNDAAEASTIQQVGSKMLTDDDKHAIVSDDSQNSFPEPYMFVTMKDTAPWTKQPMFPMEYILDVNPFLIKSLNRSLTSLGSPVEILYSLLEATNPLRQELKLQILTRYGVDEASGKAQREAEQRGEDADEPEAQEPVVRHLQLVASVPSAVSWWRRELLSTEQQCQLLGYTSRFQKFYKETMESPWLLYLWGVSMCMVGFWLALLHYFLRKAHQQQAFLMRIQDLHAFILTTLAETKPKSWEGHELKEHAWKECEAVQGMDQDAFYKRLWPRVVFESRTDANVSKCVIVRGGNLVDIWTWVDSTEE